MPNLTIDGFPVAADSVFKLRKGLEGRAIAKAGEDGADNVFFAVGGDVYVASGRNLPVSKAAKGAAVTYNGLHGRVSHVDDQLNSATDGLAAGPRAMAAAGGLVAAGAGAIGAWGGAALFENLGMGRLPAMALMAAGSAWVYKHYIAIAAALGLAGTVAYGALREADTGYMGLYAQ